MAAIAQGLAACGVRVEEGADSLTIHGLGGAPKGDVCIAAKLDRMYKPSKAKKAAVATTTDEETPF